MSRDASVSDMRRRMSALVVEAESLGIDITDTIPPAMKDHFGHLEELKEAKARITECETQNKQHLERIEKLTNERDQAEQQAVNAPSEYEQLKVDNKQLEHKVQFYKVLLEDEQKHHKSLMEKYQKALKERTQDNLAWQNLTRLEAQTKEQSDIIMKLTEQLRLSHKTFDVAHKHNESEVEQMNDAMVKLTKQVVDLESARLVVEAESEEIILTYQDFIAQVETDRQHDEVALNEWSACVQHTFRYKAAALSEARVLHTYFTHLENVLEMFRGVLHQLLSTDKCDVHWTPKNMQGTISSARLECDTFEVVHGMFEIEAREGDEIFGKLNALSDLAKKVQEHVEGMGKDLEKFLLALREQPGTWGKVKAKVGKRHTAGRK
ncbi:hypothetical protein P154DRAFT_610061 [Amniculicola lignicola CBS 123094]|uniref:Uncharacterized protein n=1 Tax=Amniculicola lignicola CBS 123094 TaxID=1392246 RepID=A0A6A5W9A0_9PLEO|nr:hypothetical protein P154DRAFT_610061 [Amniculicola lignicola CBS 123094]